MKDECNHHQLSICHRIVKIVFESNFSSSLNPKLFNKPHTMYIQTKTSAYPLLS